VRSASLCPPTIPPGWSHLSERQFRWISNRHINSLEAFLIGHLLIPYGFESHAGTDRRVDSYLLSQIVDHNFRAQHRVLGFPDPRLEITPECLPPAPLGNRGGNLRRQDVSLKYLWFQVFVELFALQLCQLDVFPECSRERWWRRDFVIHPDVRRGPRRLRPNQRLLTIREIRFFLWERLLVESGVSIRCA
jgi:hypothetical protein